MTDQPTADTTDGADLTPPRYTRARWLVVRQYNHRPDQHICGHRWLWTADVCARRRAWGHPSEVGVHYNTLPGSRA